MPIIGKSGFIKPNVIKNYPSPPIPIGLGSLTINKTFGDHPTASIEYQGITERDISNYLSAYNPRRSNKITLEGIPFRVKEDGGFSYERTNYFYKQSTRFNIYSVKIELDGWWRKLCDEPIAIKKLIVPGQTKISINRLASAAKVSLSCPNFLITIESQDGEISLASILESWSMQLECYVSYDEPSVKLKKITTGGGRSFPAATFAEQKDSNVLGVPPYYNGQELTFGTDEKKVDTFILIEPPPKFEQVAPKIEETVENDDQVEEPPADTQVIRDLSSNHDKSGPKKTKKTTRAIDGKPDSEITEIWGFAYNYEDGDNPQEEFIITDPKKYWVEVEHEERRYIYEQVETPPVSINVVDPQGGTSQMLAVHPDYVNIVTISLSGNSAQIQTTVEYLTEITTSGWKLQRPSDEPAEDGSTTLDGAPPNGSPFYPLMKFRRIPREDRTKYYLKAASLDYGNEGGGQPFEVEWSNWQELAPELRSRILNNGTIIQSGTIGASNVRIAILKPDLNYVTPMLVWAESRQGSSFKMYPHPDNQPPDNFVPPLICGEESYYQDIWTKLDADRCREKIVEFSAADAGFSTLSEKTKYRRVIGRPPEAQYRERKWEQKKDDVGTSTTSSTQAFSEKYYIYSDKIPSSSRQSGGTLNFPNAKTLQEALKAAKTQLIVEGIHSSTKKSVAVSWYYPEINPGDFCTFGDDRLAGYGRWRVTTVKYTLKYDITKNPYGIVCICEAGTELECGIDESRSVRVNKVKTPVAPDSTNSQQGQDPQIEQNIKSGAFVLGGLLPAAPSRRKN